MVLLGPGRHTKLIEHKLPASVRKRTVHVPHLWREEDAAGSLAGVEAFLRGVEMRRQEARVTELLNRERGIVTGVDETLALLQRGRLASLVAAESFNPALRYCPACDHAGASSARVCARCGGEQAEVTLHEILPQLLVRHGCEGELLSGRPAGRLRIAGSIGGWLRYRSRIRASEAPPRMAAPLAAAGAA